MEELTRDVRTVFVGQLQVRITERDVKRFFKKVAGVKVKDIQLIKDRHSGRSKGFAYVELKSLDDVPKALVLNGQRFRFKNGKLGYPVLVKASEAEKNYAWGIEKQNEMENSKKIRISNLHLGVSEKDLRNVLDPFGGIRTVQLFREESTGQSIGCAIVEFRSADMANRVASKIQGLDLAGKAMEVRPELEIMQEKKKQQQSNTTSATATATSSAPHAVSSTQAPTRSVVSNDSILAAVGVAITNGAASKPAVAALPIVPAAPSQNSNRQHHSSAASNWRLDSGTSTSMTPQARTLLMQKLAGSSTSGGGATVLAAPLPIPIPAPQIALPAKTPPVGDPSSCMVVKNMFDAEREEHLKSSRESQGVKCEDWDKEIHEDVVEECAKYGTVKHCYVDKNSQGFVYLMFDSVESGRKCGFDLSGRYFSRMRLSVQFFPESVYVAKFPSVGVE
eukprot:g3259.t1